MKQVRILLSLPRTGTHFFWTRLVASGRYQLIYDADRIPALAVLRDAYDKPLHFMHPPPLNPNYNFQYNSVREAKGPLTAAEHLNLLARKYGCRPDPEELFHRIMSKQDHEDRTLFSVNRFIYTCRYSMFFSNFCYTISHAVEALNLLEKWLAQGPYRSKTVLIVRDIDGWVRSQIQMQGVKNIGFVRERLEDFPAVMDACGRLDIPIYDMAHAIEAVSGGRLEFDEVIKPLPASAIRTLRANAAVALIGLPTRTGKGSMFRPKRFYQYWSEADPIKRLSLVRSIGWLPVALAGLLPVLGKTIRQDYEGVALDNGRVRLGPSE
jgi:hypothetical protein